MYSTANYASSTAVKKKTGTATSTYSTDRKFGIRHIVLYVSYTLGELFVQMDQNFFLKRKSELPVKLSSDRELFQYSEQTNLRTIHLATHHLSPVCGESIF